MVWHELIDCGDRIYCAGVISFSIKKRDQSAPEDINQHRNNNADDDHRCNGDEDPAASVLDTDIAWQFAEPVQQPGGELEDQPQDQND